jgi:uncharacterized membrane protein YeaQ/YmgE (transglycosylase-associated protein family)
VNVSLVTVRIVFIVTRPVQVGGHRPRAAWPNNRNTDGRGDAAMLFADVATWAAIGLAASMAAMMWPARRGLGGIPMTLTVGIGGSIVVGLLAWWFHVVPDPKSARAYMVAAVGATLCLFAMHILIERHARVRARSA